MDPQTIVPPAPQTDQTAAEPVAAEVLDDVQPQVAEALQKSKNVLVTVGVDPSVDELAAALGLTVLLGKIGKHATAVFSGKTPPAIEFLDPEKTFEDTVDSLRDFIIALDKEKADKLRYKVEDDVVKIFITPYRTVIGEKDLEFSQGDFNVDAVITLGVEKKEELDKAITAHGRILHNAIFITVNAGAATTSLGTINWADAEASSIAEMLVRLSANLGDDVLDPQISTAFLTGIVAETNRFSNEKTTPKVMTMSAQLMAAGANQQLIASNLRQEGMISESVRLQQKNGTADDGEMVLTHKSEKGDAKADTPKKQSPKPESAPKPSSTSTPKKEPKVAQPQPEKPEPSLQPVTTPSPSKALEDALQEAASEQKTVATAEPPAMPPAAPEAHISSARKVIIPPSESAAAPISTPPIEAVQTTEIAPPTITPPPARDAMEKPQFGGALNSFADTPSTAPEPAAEQFTLTHGSADTEAAVQKEAVEAARKAVEDAAIEPSHQRLESIGATPLPQAPVVPDAQPMSAIEPVMPPLPQPVPQPLENPTPVAPAPAPVAMPPLPAPAPFAPAPFSPADPSLPPMPPMPASTDGGLPPLPPMPGQPAAPTSTMAPQTAPSFLQDLQQSQNNWTQAGQSVGEAKAAANAERQTKIEERLQDYDQAVDRNRELQGLPPANNPYNPSRFPPAAPPQFPQ